MVADARLIDELGGPTKVARLLGYRERGGVQRVQNWKTRGIPARVKLANPDLFNVELNKQPSEQMDQAASTAGPACLLIDI